MRNTRFLALALVLPGLMLVATFSPVIAQVDSQRGERASLESPAALAPQSFLALATDGAWNQFTWLSGPNVDATPTFDVTGPAVIDVTDVQITGDQFEVFDGATSLGQTSAPTEPDGGATATWSTAGCDSAFDNPSPNYSKETFLVAGPGVHTITVRNIRIPTNPTTYASGDGCIRAVPALPDLVVFSLSHDPASPDSEDQIEFTAVVKNIGNLSAGPSTLSFKIGGESPSDPDALFAIPALAPGATETVVRTLQLDAGNYINTAVADFNDDVAESDETTVSNTKTDSYTVTQATVETTGVVYSIVTLPLHGDLFEGDGAGNPVGSALMASDDVAMPTDLVFVPDAGYEGLDSFIYRCTDNNILPPNNFDEATVDIIVSSAGTGVTLTVEFPGTGSGDVSLDVGGSVVAICSADCTESFGPGDVVKLQARPIALNTFDTWGGACSIAGSSQIATITLPVSGGSVCTAKFDP